MKARGSGRSPTTGWSSDSARWPHWSPAGWGRVRDRGGRGINRNEEFEPPGREGRHGKREGKPSRKRINSSSLPHLLNSFPWSPWERRPVRSAARKTTLSVEDGIPTGTVG